MTASLGNPAVATGLEKFSFHSNPKERQCQRILKLLHTCTHHTVAQRLKGLPARWETRVQSLGQEDPLEKEMATHSSILAWRIPWTEKPDRLQSTGSQSQTRLSKFTFTSHASKVMLKILQARLQQYMNRELPDV